jgi:hypothetical protein
MTSRGKRTTQLDFNAPADAETLRTLVRDADVFFQSYRPSGLEERGFGDSRIFSGVQRWLLVLDRCLRGRFGVLVSFFFGWSQWLGVAGRIC